MKKRIGLWKYFISIIICSFLLLFILSLKLYKQIDDNDNVKERLTTSYNIEKLSEIAENNNAKRLNKIREICEKYNLGIYKNSATSISDIFYPPTPQYEVFYIDRINNLAYCPIYKAGSSTWIYNMILLGGYTEEEIEKSKNQLSTIARKLYPVLDYPEAENALHNSKKLFVTRHPFERLLSAYRDKLENINEGHEYGTLHFYKKFGSKIVKKYRMNGNKTKTWEILKNLTYFWDPKKKHPTGIEPTFAEFIRYLIDTDLFNYSDDHWIPYNLFCTPCLLNYDYVGRVETMLQDQLYVIHSSNLENKIEPLWRHKLNTNQFNAKEISKMYFSQLTADEIEKLYVKYKLDFEMFDYDYEDYLNYSRIK